MSNVRKASRAVPLGSWPRRSRGNVARQRRTHAAQDDTGSSISATPDAAAKCPVVALSRRQLGDGRHGVQAIVAASAITASPFTDRGYRSRSATRMIDSGAMRTLLTPGSAGLSAGRP